MERMLRPRMSHDWASSGDANAARRVLTDGSLGILRPDINVQAVCNRDVIDLAIGAGWQRHTIHASYPFGPEGRAYFVSMAALGKPEQHGIQAVMAAITSILASPEYRAGRCGSLTPRELHGHQWEIAVALRDITELRRALPVHDVGPLAAPVVAAQRNAITIAENATSQRVRAIENYAAQVARADGARRDWLTAQQAATRNDRYRDLVARTAADAHATDVLNAITATAADAERALRDTLADAIHAAEILAL